MLDPEYKLGNVSNRFLIQIMMSLHKTVKINIEFTYSVIVIVEDKSYLDSATELIYIFHNLGCNARSLCHRTVQSVNPLK